GHIVRYIVESGREQPTTFGELDRDTTPRLEQIAEVFKGAGFPVALCADMDAWLKTHVAEISPTANALYLAGGDNHRLAHTRDGVVLMIRAIREGYEVLRALGIPIAPSNHKIVNWIPEPLLVPLVRKMLDSKDVELKAAGHANAARHEMKQIADEFRALARKTSVPTPAMSRLYMYIDPATPPVAAGSAEIPLDWRGVWIGLGGLAVLVLAVILLI
ncbi:MAG: hypothetical protein GY801_45760, partial [bacterium]|nr:hypothetical protein [bacterium]